MAEKSSTLDAYRPLILLAGIVLVTATLYWAQQVLLPLALAILLAFGLSPLVVSLQRLGLGRVLSVILVACLSSLVLAGIGTSLVIQLKGLAIELPQYRANLSAKIASLREMGEASWLRDLEDVFKEATGGDHGANPPNPALREPPPAVRVEPPGALSAVRVVGPTVELLAGAGLVIVLVLFMLIEREDLRNRLVKLIGHGRLIHTTRAFEEAAHRLSRFLLMQVFVNSMVGVVIGLGLLLIGIPYPILWGIMVALLRFIPYVGIWLAVVPIMLVSVAVTPTWTAPLLALALVGVVELVNTNVVEPLLFGHSTGVAPIALIVAAAFWTWLWGPVGLVLSTPMTVCLVVLGRYVPRLEFLGVLLGEKAVVEPEIIFYQRLLARDEDEAADVVKAFVEAHPRETVYDELLTPALVLARRDRHRRELKPDDEQFIFQTMDGILDDLGWLPSQTAGVAESPTDASTEVESQPVRVLACPAFDGADELALKMLQRLTNPCKCQLEVLSSDVLAAEVISRIEKEGTPLVCVGTLPPGGVARARYLCKRLRAAFPDLKIVVLRWGLPENQPRRQKEFTTAGADLVAGSLIEARDKIVPLVCVLNHSQGSTIPAPPVVGGPGSVFLRRK